MSAGHNRDSAAAKGSPQRQRRRTSKGERQEQDPIPSTSGQSRQMTARQISTPGPEDRGKRFINTFWLMENCFRQLIELMADSLSHTTLKVYSRVWAEWIANTDAEKGLKYHQSHILATFSYLLKLKKTGICGSTVQKNMAALSFLFKIFSWKDVTKEFLIKIIVKGWKINTAVPDKRTPLSFETLNKLLKVVPNVCRDKYETILFKTAFSLAFFGAFRIGELVSPSRSKQGVLNIRDIKILGQSVFFKHPKNNQGPFLIHEDSSYVSRYQFLVIFRACLKAISLCPRSFCTHSFRIGAATEASQLCFHEDRIKRLGRWSSNRFKSYIRPHLLTSSKSS
ncbi:hypothetical protein XELAEV_18006028mg [Xenopus laevis]|uniref:Tyr recombinase domain-containing protein n=1 Tax=Xenopus laevis TaxID=8355 RepID=A0A974I3Z5_XENLA|nr:hypothetical protein XELAEV_18006028mg [Xenopus laevis]